MITRDVVQQNVVPKSLVTADSVPIEIIWRLLCPLPTTLSC